MPNVGIKNALHLFIKNGGFKNLTWLPVCYENPISFMMIILLILTSSNIYLSTTNGISRNYKNNSFEDI